MKKTLSTLVGAVAGTALALSLAGPALATTPNPSGSQALQAWLSEGKTQSATAPVVARPAATAAVHATPASGQPTKGMRLTHKHGGPWLWTENILEGYWNHSKITSSSGAQDYGFLFPNTASKGGIVRTLVTRSQHNWRGTMIVGAGVVTPWGAVDVSRTSQTDYYELVRGGDDYINP